MFYKNFTLCWLEWGDTRGEIAVPNEEHNFQFHAECGAPT